MRKTFAIVSILFLSVAFIASCNKSNPGQIAIDCSTVTNKNFATDVNPLIQTLCNQPSCHNVASVNGPGPLTNYTQVFNARIAIRGQVEAGLMPQNTTLNAAQKKSIICWIDGGAPNN
jgi:hypothetical protein